MRQRVKLEPEGSLDVMGWGGAESQRPRHGKTRQITGTDLDKGKAERRSGDITDPHRSERGDSHLAEEDHARPGAG